MAKCETCRKADVLDSWWDKQRLKLFHLFHNDIIDLSQDKFTQGFSDGYAMGRKHEKAAQADNVQVEVIPRELPPIDLGHVLTSDKTGHLYLNGVLVDQKLQKDLVHEASLIRNTRIWDILSNTLKQNAQLTMFNHSKDMQDLMNGKTILYTIDTQENIIKSIERSR